MLSPIPLVVRTSGDASAAPEGSVPVALYGSGGGGGGDGRTYQYASKSINDSSTAKWELVYSTGDFEWLSLRVASTAMTTVGQNEFLVLQLPADFQVDSPTGYTIFQERTFIMSVTLTTPNAKGIVEASGSIILGDTSVFGVSGMNLLIPLSGFSYSTNPDITEDNFRGGILTFTF